VGIVEGRFLNRLHSHSPIVSCIFALVQLLCCSAL
jgi:hypothetical protein